MTNQDNFDINVKIETDRVVKKFEKDMADGIKKWEKAGWTLMGIFISKPIEEVVLPIVAEEKMIDKQVFEDFVHNVTKQVTDTSAKTFSQDTGCNNLTDFARMTEEEQEKALRFLTDECLLSLDNEIYQALLPVLTKFFAERMKKE